MDYDTVVYFIPCIVYVVITRSDRVIILYHPCQKCQVLLVL